MLYVLVGLLVTAVLLKFVASILPDFELDGWVPALSVAVIDRILGSAVGFALAAAAAPYFGTGGWIGFGVGMAISVAVMSIAIAVVPAAKAGAMSSIAAAVLVSGLQTGVMFAIASTDAGNLLTRFRLP